VFTRTGLYLECDASHPDLSKYGPILSLCLDLTAELSSSPYFSCTGKAVVQLGSPFFWDVLHHHWTIDGLDPDVSRQCSRLVLKG